MGESSVLIRSDEGWATPRAYSSDLRERLVAAVKSGMSRREAAEIFDVAISTAVKWMQRVRDTGSWAAKPRGGSTSRLEQHTEQILTVIKERPDATLKEILVALRKQRIRTSRTALWRFLDRHRITRKKKSLHAIEQEREDVARARRKWKREQGLLDSTKLVFIDETSVNTNMLRLYGRCPCGQRLVDHEPFGQWKTLTFVSALRHDGMVAPMLIDGPMDGELLLAYVEQCLVPTLKPDDIVVADNLVCHKVAGVVGAIEAAGATLRYLPQYSPDLNPIEMAFSKFKAHLRKLAQRTIPGIRHAIRSFLSSLRGKECANYLGHAGYAST
jgi:transposase